MRGGVILLVLPCCCLGCDGFDLPDDEVWTSEHFRYHVRRNEADACSGITDTLERHLALTSKLFALPAPRKPIDYYKFLNPADLRKSEACPDFTTACADTIDVEIFSGLPLDRHELTHAYFAALGWSQVVFEEGIAHALDCHMLAPRPTRVDWREAFATPASRFDATFRAAASRLVAYLVLAYGPAKFVELYVSTPRSFTADESDAVFTAQYGLSLSDAWQTALAQKNLEFSCLRFWECAAPALALGSYNFQLHQACDKNDEFRSFQVDVRRPYLHEDPYFDPGLRVASCDPFRPAVHEQQVDPTWGDVGAQLQVFEPGRYFVASVVHPGVARVAAVPDAFASSCDSEPGWFPDTLNLTTTGLTIYPEPDRLAGGPLFMRFPVDDYFGTLTAQGSPGVEVRACGACVDGTSSECSVLFSNEQAAGVMTSAANTIEINYRGSDPHPWFRLLVE